MMWFSFFFFFLIFCSLRRKILQYMLEVKREEKLSAARGKFSSCLGFFYFIMSYVILLNKWKYGKMSKKFLFPTFYFKENTTLYSFRLAQSETIILDTGFKKIVLMNKNFLFPTFYLKENTTLYSICLTKVRRFFWT